MKSSWKSRAIFFTFFFWTQSITLRSLPFFLGVSHRPLVVTRAQFLQIWIQTKSFHLLHNHYTTTITNHSLFALQTGRIISKTSSFRMEIDIETHLLSHWYSSSTLSTWYTLCWLSKSNSKQNESHIDPMSYSLTSPGLFFTFLFYLPYPTQTKTLN